MGSPLFSSARTGLLLALPVLLISCGTKQDAASIGEIQAKTAELSRQGDLLATRAQSVQAAIKELGSEETTGEKIVRALESQEKELTEEGARLEKIVGGLTEATAQIEREHAAFIKKYPVR